MATRREYAVAVFVVHDGAVLMHFHRKLDRWLPPGGHVDADELPDDAAVREVREEVGLTVHLIDATTSLYRDVSRGNGVPARLRSPIGIQLEDIPARPGNPAHQHIDFVYAAVVAPGTSPTPIDAEGGSAPRWVTPADWVALGASDEVVSWADAALRLAAAHGASA